MRKERYRTRSANGSCFYGKIFHLRFLTLLDIKEELDRATKDLIEFYYERAQKEKEKILEEAKKRLESKEKDTFRKKLETYCLEKKLHKPIFSFVGNEHSM